MAKAKAAAAATSDFDPLQLNALAAILAAWGISWDEVKARILKAQELHPDVPLNAAEIIAILDGYVNRNHIANMIRNAADLVLQAIQTGWSGNELDPSALS